MTSFLALDFEATERNPVHARIVQVGLARFDGGNLAEASGRLVDPGVPIPRGARAVHGIGDEHVACEAGVAEVLPRLLSRLRGALVVGYCVINYDLELLRAECRRHGFRAEYAETMASLRGVVDAFPFAAATSKAPRYQKGARTLATMSRSRGIVLDKAHDAAADAVAVGELALALVAEGTMPPLQEAAEALAPTWRHLLNP